MLAFTLTTAYTLLDRTKVLECADLTGHTLGAGWPAPAQTGALKQLPALRLPAAALTTHPPRCRGAGSGSQDATSPIFCSTPLMFKTEVAFPPGGGRMATRSLYSCGPTPTDQLCHAQAETPAGLRHHSEQRLCSQLPLLVLALPSNLLAYCARCSRRPRNS